jgi:hypothetical protein
LGIGKRQRGGVQRGKFFSPAPTLHSRLPNIFVILVAVIAKVKGKRENFYF